MRKRKLISGIYGIFDKETHDLLYVGKSIDIISRVNCHFKRKYSKKDTYYKVLMKVNTINQHILLIYESFFIYKLYPLDNIVRHHPIKSYFKTFRHNLLISEAEIKKINFKKIYDRINYWRTYIKESKLNGTIQVNTTKVTKLNKPRHIKKIEETNWEKICPIAAKLYHNDNH